MNCIFCSIVKGEIPSRKLYEDDNMLAFADIHPQAKVHVLVIPKPHIPSLDGITGENAGLIAALFEKIPAIARAAGLENGYRLVSNCGADACQTVPHLHFHLLGGQPLSEKMA